MDKKQGWISVDDRIPDTDGWYITERGGGVHAEYFIKDELAIGHWTLDDRYCAAPTHWQPLPEPPKEEA